MDNFPLGFDREVFPDPAPQTVLLPIFFIDAPGSKTVQTDRVRTAEPCLSFARFGPKFRLYHWKL